MNLSPEEKKTGKANFDESVGTTRRDFLKKGIAATVVAGSAGMGAFYFGYQKLENPLRVGIIGTGDEGNVLIGALNPDFIDVVAIADIRPYSLHRAYYGDWYSTGAHAARPGLLKVYKEKYDWKDRDEARTKNIKEYTEDYKAILDDPNVEAVIIALPLHLHHEAAIAAMRKGKHVLTEKLMGHSVAQCKEMARVAAVSSDPNGKPIQLAVGHQRHYSILYANAVDQIRQGLIGDIHHIRAQWHRGNLPGNDSWQPPLPGEDKLQKELDSWKQVADGKHKNIPKPDSPELMEELQSKIRQKEAQIADISDELATKWGYQAKELSNLPKPRTRTAQEELIRWRLWERTGGGLMAELGSHQLDAASIFVSAQHGEGKHIHPLNVTAVGGRHVFPADRDCEDHVYCIFEFPGKGYDEDNNKKIVVTYSSINGNGFGGYGEIVYGTKGTLILEQEQDAMLFKGSDTATRIEIKPGKDGKPAMDTYETGGGAGVAQAAAGSGPPSRGYREEIEHWAWCIRTPDEGGKPHCTPEVALGDAVIALTSNLAIRKGTRIDFDPKWFDPNDDATPEGQAPRQAADIA